MVEFPVVEYMCEFVEWHVCVWYVYSLALLWIIRYPTLCLPEILKSHRCALPGSSLSL